MQYQPKGTLAYYDALPHTKQIKLGHIPTKVVAINCSKFVHAHELIKPETEALNFYGLNHLASMVRSKFTKHEELPEWAVEVMDAYTAQVVKGGRRMMTYLALITARESRHVHKDGKLHKAMDEQFGPGIFSYLETVPDNPHSAVTTFMNHPPPGTLSQYFNGLQHVFYHGQFGGGGFGGAPWGDIAKCLTRFLEGETSMEVMLDTSFTLCHNNGPIFNKGMCYNDYYNQDKGPFIRMLDIQRSGQIPEAILHDGYTQNFVPMALKKLVTKIVKLFPDEFGTEVDWFKVCALGAVGGDYTHDKSKMKNKPPPPKVIKSGGEVVGKLQVFPGQTVDVIKRITQPA